MAEVVEKLSDFPGFGVKYDPEEKPFFKAQLIEALRLLYGVNTGKQILWGIAAAKPKHRADFPAGINVMGVPVHVRFIQSGYKPKTMYDQKGKPKTIGLLKSDNPAHSSSGCPFWVAGGSANQALDTTAGGNGTGSVCYMKYTNAQTFTNKGEKASPHIVLGHELLHSLHALEGKTKSTREDEEWWTVGLKEYKDEVLCENALRSDFNMTLRTKYFDTD